MGLKKPDFNEIVRDLIEEEAGWEVARALGAAIHEACAGLAHKGGDLPYDGVIAAIYSEVLRREGWVDVEPLVHTEVSLPLSVVEP